MGWTGKPISHWKRKGKGLECDRNAEIHAAYGGSEAHRIIKSAMCGSTWYGAIQETHRDEGGILTWIPPANRATWALVVLTRVQDGIFYYKPISEDMGPAKAQCPKSILSLLSPTDVEYAKEWRQECFRYHEEKNRLAGLPIGTIIEIPWCSGRKQYRKSPPMYQFRTPFWISMDGEHYLPKTKIRNYEIIALPQESTRKDN